MVVSPAGLAYEEAPAAAAMAADTSEDEEVPQASASQAPAERLRLPDL